MMKRVLLFGALIVWSTMAAAVVYKWTDADGHVHYGDQPPDGVKAEVVELLGTHTTSAASPPQSSRTAAAPLAPAAAAAKPATQDPGDAAAAHAQQCAEAQQRLKQLTEGRHIYKPGPNGERQYLTSDQIDAERADAKSEVDQICASQ
jgi:hypothetical protein